MSRTKGNVLRQVYCVTYLLPFCGGMGKLTVKAIEALSKSGESREVPEGLVRGLYFFPLSGSWLLRYRHNGRPRKYTFEGRYPELGLEAVRKLATERWGEIAQGRDPATEKKERKAANRTPAARDLVENIVEIFIERHVKANQRAGTARECERVLNREVISRWRGHRFSEIKRADILDMLDEIVDRGSPIAANRYFADVRNLCNWAVGRGLIDVSPCVGVRPPSAAKSRDRILSDDELCVLWQACEELNYPFGPLVKLLILSGQRLREVAHARWPEIDLTTRTWTLPRERSKNNQAHDVPLSNAAIAILESLPRFSRTELVFTTTGRTPVSGFSKAKRVLDVAMPPDAAPWVLHDIRRTFASGCARLGVNLPTIEKVINHTSGSFAGIVKVYQRHSFEAEKRVALEVWGQHMERLISGAADNVVPLTLSKK